jgi:hypothetical protein
VDTETNHSHWHHGDIALHFVEWHLDERVGNKISSYFVKSALDHVDPDTKESTVWSDSCPGHRCNTLIDSAHMWLLCEMKFLEIVNHKYLLKGHTHTHTHTHTEADHVHGVIERKNRGWSLLKLLCQEIGHSLFEFVAVPKNPLKLRK